MQSLFCKGQECQANCLLFAFFLGFVNPFVDLALFLATFGAALDPLVDLEPLVVALFPFVAAELAPFTAGALDEFALREAKNSSTEAYPVVAKIRLIVGESSLI